MIEFKNTHPAAQVAWILMLPVLIVILVPLIVAAVAIYLVISAVGFLAAGGLFVIALAWHGCEEVAQWWRKRRRRSA